MAPLKRALENISTRGGDLTRRLDVPGSDELSQLYRAFNESSATTEQLVANVKQGAMSVKVASGEIALGNQIRQLIGNNVNKINEGEALVSNSSDILETISTQMKKMSDFVSEITSASTEQSSGIEQINQAMSQLEEVTQQNAALVEQMAAASKSLDEQSEEMAGVIGQFKVSAEAAQAIARQAAQLPAPVDSYTHAAY